MDWEPKIGDKVSATEVAFTAMNMDDEFAQLMEYKLQLFKSQLVHGEPPIPKVTITTTIWFFPSPVMAHRGLHITILFHILPPLMLFSPKTLKIQS